MQYIFSTLSDIQSKKVAYYSWLILFDVNIHTPNLFLSINVIIVKNEFKWQHAKQIQFWPLKLYFAMS